MKNSLLFGVTAVTILSASTVVLAQHTFPRERSHCSATLVANDPGSRITLRANPGTNSRSLGYGLVGDRIYVLTLSPPELDYATDRQGYTWYRVGFPGSGAKGWIREDFLRLRCVQNDL
ncbi:MULTISPECIES: SH3 domain-containing protein [Spirulina sp. CCY15215]|uniref:SH3 domain-containing protein n=1 Tax=Spirulina sp. CCY15215 TaxID=2767591 RepID=UPI0019521204|nr:SH3 domain-containing protein [Spirulina major]